MSRRPGVEPIDFYEDPRWLNRHPSSLTRRWTDCVNGLARGPEHWYLATETAVHRFRAGEWPSGSPDRTLRAVGEEIGGERFGHVGDLDCDVAGNLWVPLEGGTLPSVGLFDRDLNYVCHWPLPGQIESPWCAVGPGVLYSSDFNTEVVHAYGMPSTGTSNLVRTIPLSERLTRVQGGCLLPDGRLLLSCDSDDGARLVSVGESGDVRTEVRIPRRNFGLKERIVNWFAGRPMARDEELQGLALDGDRVSVLLADKRWIGPDDLILLHYRL